MNSPITPRTEELIAIYQQAAALRGRIGQFIRRQDTGKGVAIAASESEEGAINLLATLESLLGESLKADMADPDPTNG